MPKIEAQRNFLLMREGKRIELTKGEVYDVTETEYNENWHHGMVVVDEEAAKAKADSKKK